MRCDGVEKKYVPMEEEVNVDNKKVILFLEKGFHFLYNPIIWMRGIKDAHKKEVRAIIIIIENNPSNL